MIKWKEWSVWTLFSLHVCKTKKKKKKSNSICLLSVRAGMVSKRKKKVKKKLFLLLRGAVKLSYVFLGYFSKPPEGTPPPLIYFHFYIYIYFYTILSITKLKDFFMLKDATRPSTKEKSLYTGLFHFFLFFTFISNFFFIFFILLSFELLFCCCWFFKFSFLLYKNSLDLQLRANLTLGKRFPNWYGLFTV